VVQMPIVDLSQPPRPSAVCPVCMAYPDVRARYPHLLSNAEIPGREYNCPECGLVWSLPPLVEPAYSVARIDWSESQPAGVYRCQEGWSDTGGAEYGCNERGLVECSDDNLRCTDHALIFELAGIRQVINLKTDHAIEHAAESTEQMERLIAELNEVNTALWDINYTHMSLSRKVWYPIRRWLYEHRVLPWANRNG
jgi:hypothetical protein